MQSEPLALSLLNTGDYEKKLVALQAQLRESVAGYQAELLSTQTHLAQLESQVRGIWPATGKAETGMVLFIPHQLSQKGWAGYQQKARFCSQVEVME